MTRIGVVSRYTDRSRAGYPLGLALQRLGATYVPIDVRDVTAAVDGPGPPRVRIGEPDLDEFKLDGLLWRISENDLYRFIEAQRLLAGRLPMINPLPCHEICADKWSTSVALAAAGVPIVPTTLLSPGNPVPAFPGVATVIKPVVGARGRGLRIASARSVPPIDEVHVAQPQIGGAVTDQVRALVCGRDQVLAAYRVPQLTRPDGLPVNNLEAGGTPLAAAAEPVRDLALAAARHLGGVLLGVDLVRWNGEWAVLEVNSSPGMSGVAAVSDVDAYELAARAVLDGIESAVASRGGPP
ncbi:ATP-grasp domain-containing protein [Symbioplanes lichenis]|uniref:ATP-grasp domain-containing protein n=1 Tax=Symbioplanes lichenis TaxID=1629072 RepID=UPI002738A9AC|nr:ATP-grasp domain-containing protein [Actinoplanes lichenis]